MLCAILTHVIWCPLQEYAFLEITTILSCIKGLRNTSIHYLVSVIRTDININPTRSTSIMNLFLGPVSFI